MKWAFALAELLLLGVIAVLAIGIWDLPGPMWAHIAFTLFSAACAVVAGWCIYDIVRD